MTIKELRTRCQNTHLLWSSHPWLFHQFRKISIYLTWLLLHTPLTPNAITLLAIAGGILTGVLFALGYWITGVITLLIVVILDFSDGEVSRYRGTQSKEGTYLDKIYIFAVHPSPIAGMTIGVYNSNPTEWVLVAGFIDTISIFVLCMVTELGLQIAVWKHCKRFLDRLNQDPGFLTEQLRTASSLEANAATASNGPPTVLDRARNSRLGLIAKRAVGGWDFPYIFCFMALAIVAQLILGWQNNVAGIGPTKLFLYFYAITYPPLIWFMLLKNVSVKAIERDYGQVTNEIMQLLEKARRS
jgi:phosphatidylglycerophosphate synthase